MGMPGPCRRSCSVYPTTKQVFAPNPNPLNFEILELKQVGFNVVARIKYPDCRNFEGVKICVFTQTNCNKIRSMASIDPHFENNSMAPFARFKPTIEGWNVAVNLAAIL